MNQAEAILASTTPDEIRIDNANLVVDKTQLPKDVAELQLVITDVRLIQSALYAVDAEQKLRVL